MKKAFSTAIMLAFCATLLCQKAVNVCGEYTYYPPENITVEQAKRIAIDRAKIAALEEKFGSVVSQSNTTVMKANGESSGLGFYSLGSSEVKGDWVEDISVEATPSYSGNTLVISAKVCGKAREVTAAKAELAIAVLCNSVETERFRSGDRFALRFKSPVAGYVAVFFLDEVSDTVYCMLPYEGGEARQVKARSVYTFFCAQDPLYPKDQEDMWLEADKEVDINHLFVVFSPNPFVLPLMETGEIDSLPFEKYNKWVQKCKVKDAGMQVIEKVVEIRK